MESDRGKEWYDSIFRSFLKGKKIHHHSRYTDKGPSIAERLIRPITKLLKKPVFEKCNAIWLLEPTSVIKKSNNTIHSSTKKTPLEASKKSNEKLVYSNLQERRVRQQPKNKMGDLVRTSDIR